MDRPTPNPFVPTPAKLALLLLLGALLPIAWPSLAKMALGVFLLAVLFGAVPRLRPLAWILLGLALAAHAVGKVREGWLAPALEGQPLALEIQVESLPEPRTRGVVFLAKVVQPPPGQEEGFPQRVRLSWTKEAPELVPGEVWRVEAKLKRPHGLVNGVGFDYEAWLFCLKVQATGTVQGGERLATAPAWAVDRLRLAVRERLGQALAGESSLGLILGLVIGDRSLIPKASWDTLIATGTNHLLAISGLHVTMIAGLIWGLVRSVWAFVPRLALAFPAPLAGAVAGVVAALGYSLLAGFSVPTQRTLLMLTAWVLAMLARRSIRFVDGLGLALIFVLLWDPLAVLDVGFWLSFAAVALLGYVGSGPLVRPSWLKEASSAQLAMAVGLVPLTLLMFQRASLVSPLANALAIPLVTLLITPLALLGSVMIWVSESVGAGLLGLAAWLLDGLMAVLTRLAQWSWAQAFPPAAPWWAVVLALPAILWLLAPVRVPGRLAGLALLAPLLWPKVPSPADGELWLDMLDVGQGQAVLVRTATHALLFDAGPLHFGGFDTGAEVVLPWLRAEGVGRLDALVVSNEDQDHAGGLTALRQGLEVERLWSGEGKLGEPCRRGLAWAWDGVRLAYLHPAADFGARKANDLSCVLRIEAQGGSVLLTGDIERQAEWALLDSSVELKATVVQVPHHGSASSSQEAFVRAVSPKLALISAGYRNRFRHPRPEVVARWEAAGAEVLTTPACGRIQVRLRPGQPPEVECARQRWAWAWRVPVDGTGP